MPEVQANLLWTPPTGTLGRIAAEAAARAETLRREAEGWRARAAAAPPAPSFRAALRRPTVAVIAEVKRRSPSKGTINPGLDAVAQASAYEAGGAAAISVLTEPVHFGGAPEDLVAVRAAVRIPILKKDFHVDAIQLYEARALGASAALLIARALPPATLREFVRLADDIGLETLVEIRDARELDAALNAGATVIGVNNRDLETLEIDATTAAQLIPSIPATLVAVAESGMRERADVARAAAAGADAVLVGSAISASADPQAAVAQLSDVPVRRDGRRPA
jgi:indole-3-glycerol phosphate synthase